MYSIRFKRMPTSCYFLLVLFTVIHSQKIIPSRCPQITPMSEFDRDRYMGTWYQQATIKVLFKDEATCTQFLYKPIESDGFQIEARKVSRLTNGPASVYGLARRQNSSETQPGPYVVTFFGELVNEVSTNYVLYTDYNVISVVWSCDSFYGFWNKQSVQVLSRARTMNTTTLLVSTLRALIPKHLDGLFDFLNPVDQSQCEEIIPA